MSRRLTRAAPCVIDELRWLVSFAPQAGADADRVAVIAESLIDLLLDATDPRTAGALELARRIRHARDSGATIPQLVARFGRSRPTIHRLLCLTTSRDTSVLSSQTDSVNQVKHARRR